MRDIKQKKCANCSTSFKCGGNCWCNDYPSIMSMEFASDCLCKDCLATSIKTKIEEFVNELTQQKIKEIQNLGVPQTLQEGIDYTISKNGNWIFSPWYLLRQGKCCKNNCSNCPYPKGNKHHL